MSDQELLERAAKAAGIEIQRSRLDDPLWRDMLLNTRDPRHSGYGIGWNPLTNDGDALRLAVKLRLRIDYVDGQACVEGVMASGMTAEEACRRAIVRAAAGLGGKA